MHKSSAPKIWRKYSQRYRLDESSNQRQARLITWSQIESPPSGFEQFKPYIVAILEFEDGKRFTTQLVDSDLETLEAGQICVPTFRRFYEDGSDGIIHYGLKWMVLRSASRATNHK